MLRLGLSPWTLFSGWDFAPSCHNFAEDSFEVELFLANVFDLLRAGGLALNGDRALVAKSMKFREDLTKIDQALPNQNLLAELVRIGWPAAVFGMDAADVRAQDVDGIDWIGLAVEDEVRRIQTNGKVGHGDIAD